MPDVITCQRATVAELLPLRHAVLRTEKPLETAMFDGDDAPGTRHYVACRDARVVGCLSLMPSQWHGGRAWQLRGMATDTHEQGRGVGRALLEHALADAARAERAHIVWCNARTSAIGFYERLGWQVVSEPFDVPTVGPHVKMLFALDPTRRPSMAAFISVELAFLIVAHSFGGPPWVMLGVLACVAQIAADFRVRSLLGIVPALAWLAAAHTIGNRELFFPYAMYLAAHVANQFADRGWKMATAAGGAVVVAFLGIRAAQDATPRVLAVEVVVAAVILGATVYSFSLVPARKRPWASVTVAIAASIAAYVGLAL